MAPSTTKKVYFLLLMFLICLKGFGCKNKEEVYWEKLLASADVEVAKTEAERKRGLMYQEYLPQNSGMYFIFDNTEVVHFYMKNTKIPLSIAFIDEDGIIVSIRDMKPFDTTSVSSMVPVKFALEMNQGWFENNGVKVGDKVALNRNKILFYRKFMENR